ncbi:MAG TPA: M20/M25/M40 family metallo-hydrolase [Gaiellaceae bacterium]|jgi:putative aminopeptidase FrvX|nr:M20/M25/M40 family metallo-hydrolase [Gaiellaceae bacterium]
MPLPDLLERLLTTPGPSGEERAAAAVWREAAAAVGEVSSDVLGSSWVRVPGTAGGPTLLLVGHIDEIGLVVTHLGDDGLAAVRTLSGWDPSAAAYQRVDVHTRGGVVPGVVAVKRQKRKRGEDRKPIESDDLFLDVGAKDGDELRGLIRPGDHVIWHGAPLALHGNRVASRAFDNRMGCYVALESARRIAERGGAPGEVIAAAAVQEEVGDYAGSRTVAFATEPDVALAIDVTNPSDIRGADHDDEGKIVLGGGPTLSRGPSIHPDVFELLHDTAEAEGIPFAVEVSRGTTWTDADAVYVSRKGVATGVVSVPLRYMHSPVETIDLDDIERAVQLIVAFAFKLEPGQSFTG